MKGKKRILALILTLLMCISLMPTGVYAMGIDFSQMTPEEILLWQKRMEEEERKRRLAEQEALLAAQAAMLAQQWVASPVEQPVAPPVEQPVAPPVEQPVAPPVEQPVAPPVEQPVAPPVEQPVAPPVEQPVAPPVEQPVAPPVEQPVAPPVEQPVAPPVEQTVAPPVEQPVAPPVEQPAEAPAEQPAEAPAEQPAEAPAEQPAEAPAEEAAEAPAEEAAEAPAEEAAEAPAEEAAEAPAEEAAEAPAEEAAEAPAEEAAEALTEEAAEAPAEEAAEAPAEEAVEAPAEEAVEAPAEEAEEPAEEAVEALSEEAEEEGYTVEITFNGVTQVLEGGAELRLSDVLAGFGIEGNIDLAESDMVELLDAYQNEDGEWMIKSLKPFYTTHNMKVTVDGVDYDMSFTDLNNRAISIEKGGSGAYNTIADAQAAGQLTGDVWYLKLMDDLQENINIAEGTTVTIDLNGHTIKNDGDSHTIVNAGNLTILDSSKAETGTVDNTASAKAAIYNLPTGTVTLNGGNYTRSTQTNTGGYYTVKNFGTMTINDGYITHNDSVTDSSASLIANGWYSPTEGGLTHDPDQRSKLTINGGVIDGTRIAVKNDDYGKLWVNGGVINGNNQAIQNWGEAVISGGTMNSSVVTWDYAGAPDDQGKMTINGGIINGDAEVIAYGAGASDAEMTINGGIVRGDVVKAVQNASTGWKTQEVSNHSNVAEITVNGGTFADPTVSDFVSENGLVANSGGTTAVGRDILRLVQNAFWKRGVVNFTNLPKGGFVYEDWRVPPGVQIRNHTNYDLVVNGRYIGAKSVGYTPAVRCPWWWCWWWNCQPSYSVLEGKDAEWIRGSEDGLEFKLNSNKVRSIIIDIDEKEEIELEKDDYKLENDGTVTIEPEFLETLKSGEHTITFKFSGGRCSTKFVVLDK